MGDAPQLNFQPSFSLLKFFYRLLLAPQLAKGIAQYDVCVSVRRFGGHCPS